VSCNTFAMLDAQPWDYLWDVHADLTSLLVLYIEKNEREVATLLRVQFGILVEDTSSGLNGFLD
jgi:hypothetical protein